MCRFLGRTIPPHLTKKTEEAFVITVFEIPLSDEEARKVMQIINSITVATATETADIPPSSDSEDRIEHPAHYIDRTADEVPTVACG